MAEIDWELITVGAADSSMVSQGYHDAAIFDPRSGSNVYGFHALTPVVGAAGIIVGTTAFNPISNSKGGLIRCCLKKYTQLPDYSVFLFMISGKSTSAPGYLLGLSNGYPYNIILKRGPIGAGLFEGDDDNIYESNAFFNNNSWVNLELAVKVYAQGDVSLIAQIDQNDPIVPSAPSLGPITGIPEYIDDRLGILRGTPGITGDFYVGVGFHNNGGSGRIAVADYAVVGRQTSP